ncbi:metal-dependent hydrolase [Alicyclobacillus fastidiosus]|uniref:Metal-dependent hydrolase n=1 Tax=Alicyclobacillus fastidiosus TaxID=392011 RepID=A0ABV5AGG7_9BACL|nr:metal-dependent hydrolase [Alicyclobacillus fastidiosus]WEH08924.1 metal-dependent hydrolase [Alicyclobacillus fastidiosus]
MLGRTHMAIGALGAVLVLPVLLHDSTAHSMVESVGHGHINQATQLIEGVVVGALGGIVPDLDQKDGLMTRKVERIGQLAMLGSLIILLITMHLWSSPIALGIAICMFFSFVHHAEWVRKTSLILLAVGSVYFGMRFPDYAEIGICSAIWFGVTAFSKHRTFTHSLLGFAIAGFTLVQLGKLQHLVWLSDVAILGYGLHMVADAVAGGIPLFWPFGKRQGIRMVLTGSKADHLIGIFSVLLMLFDVVK